jgi:hypothetical protein
MEAVFRSDVTGFFPRPSDRILPETTSIFRKNPIISVTDTGTWKRMETCRSKKLPKHDFSSMKNFFFHHFSNELFSKRQFCSTGNVVFLRIPLSRSEPVLDMPEGYDRFRITGFKRNGNGSGYGEIRLEYCFHFRVFFRTKPVGKLLNLARKSGFSGRFLPVPEAGTTDLGILKQHTEVGTNVLKHYR